jgi:LuxR family maltose regulon positive regulatory protein
MQGRLSEAKQDYQDLIKYSLRYGMDEDVLAFAKTGLAEIALEQNRLDQADEDIGWVIENYDRIESSPLNWIRPEWLFVRLARYYLARHDLLNARVFFEKAMNGFRANRLVVHYLSSQLIDLQVMLWAATGELRSANIPFEEQIDYLDLYRKSKFAKQIALGRVSLAQGQSDRAVEIFSALIPTLEEQGLVERLMEALVLQSLAYQAAGKQPQASQSLHQALQLAIPEGYRRVFTDEGAQMRPLLEHIARHPLPEDRCAQTAVISLVSSLISELKQKAPASATPAMETRPAAELVQPMPEPFSHREQEVVRLIADGKSTKEIAAALQISVNTAKVHIKSIYRKTGAHTRSALLQRVTELGILKGGK